MTTSDESSTLYSSPQMRFEVPFCRMYSRACEEGRGRGAHLVSGVGEDNMLVGGLQYRY